MPALFDAYTFRARLLPAILTALPAALAVIAFYPGGVNWWTPMWGAITAFGGAFLLSELGRDAGSRKEPKLFELWGGKPTTQRLRHRDSPNRQILQRYRQRISELQPLLVFPSADEELGDPEHADEIYEAAANYLRERTRDKSEFPLVFQALCEYGFRRNLWGLKPFGVTISLLSTVLMVVAVFVHISDILESPALIAGTILNTLLLVMWVIRINPNWIKVTAFSYADRLLATCEVLKSP